MITQLKNEIDRTQTKTDVAYSAHWHKLLTKVAGSVSKCAQLKRGTVLCTGDSTAVKDADDFLSLQK